MPKPSRASRTPSLVLNKLEASQSAITRLENRWARKGPGGSNPSSSATKHNVALELEGSPFRLRRVINIPTILAFDAASTPYPRANRLCEEKLDFPIQGSALSRSEFNQADLEIRRNTYQ